MNRPITMSIGFRKSPANANKKAALQRQAVEARPPDLGKAEPFTHLGAVPSLYLGNGVANNGDARDMRFYENIYRNAASSGHQEVCRRVAVGFMGEVEEQGTLGRRPAA